MAANLEKIVEELSVLTVMEAADLSKMLEEQWGVSAAAPVAAAGGAARSGEEVFNTKCAACHATGAAGAPKYGTADWVERGAKGLDTLLSNAINGLNAMPPRGLCADCSDDELKASIEHMLNGSK